MLGAKGLALVGMLIVVVGLGMFLKYAHDQGWLAEVPPLARCAIGAGFGAVLLGVGELLRRRVNPLASSGTTATGVAAIYASILAASNLYGLIGTTSTFASLAGITTLGVLLGSLSNRVMLALLSLVGAFLVPVLLAADQPSFVAMPGYLLSLLVLGLVLAGWRGGGYAHVRRLSWWGVAVMGSLWAGSVYEDAPKNIIVFVGLVWLATVAELVVSARFFNTLRDRTAWPDRSAAGFVRDEASEIRFNLASLLAPEARWLNSVFGVTAWAVALAAIAIRQFRPDLDWLAPLGFGTACVAIAAFTLRLSRSPVARLWASHATPRSALAAALVVNAALLVVATVAMALGGWAQVCTWGALGLAAIETGRRLRFRAAGYFGFGLIVLAAARLGLLDFAELRTAGAVTESLGLYVTSWSLQVLYVAAVLAAAAWRFRYAVERQLAAIASLWVLAAALAHPDTAADSLGPAWLVLASAAGWLTVRVRIMALLQNAYALAATGMAVTLFGQLAFGAGTQLAELLDLDPIPMCVAMLAWLGFAAIPGQGFLARAHCAALTIASGAVALASLHEVRGVPETVLAGVVYSGILVLVSRRLFRWSVIDLVGGVLLIVTSGWVADRLTVGESAIDGVPVANVPFIAALTASVVWIVLAKRIRAVPVAEDCPPRLAELRSSIAILSFGVAWLLLLASSSIDAVRGVGTVLDERSAQGAALSIWWSLYAFASVALGFRLSAALRWGGLGLLGIVAAKVLLVDTQTLQPPARIIAALSVGLVIIGGGVLYARLMKHTQGAADADRAESPEGHPRRADPDAAL